MNKKKKTVEVEIKDVGFPNKSIGEYEDQVIKFKGGIKGQKVEVTLGKKRKTHRLGKLIGVVEKSPMEKDIGCLHSGVCGGCSYQTLTYEDELKIKEDQILSLFNKKGLTDINFQGIEESPNIKEIGRAHV